MIIPPSKWIALVTFDLQEFIVQIKLNTKLACGIIDPGLMDSYLPESDLPKLRKIIADDLPPSYGLVASWREMNAAWKIQRTDPAYAIQVELPRSK